ncbi:MAG: hypothetical protein GY743_18030 [Planctomycetaceae bacterium]|nr:hypothetical protein [Planctomycetaceae bacterium]
MVAASTLEWSIYEFDTPINIQNWSVSEINAHFVELSLIATLLELIVIDFGLFSPSWVQIHRCCPLFVEDQAHMLKAMLMPPIVLTNIPMY